MKVSAGCGYSFSQIREGEGNMINGEETQCEFQNTDYLGAEESNIFDSFERHIRLKSDETMASFETILPDDMWEKIFFFLPIASIIRVGSVCKRWYSVVHSGKYLWINMPPQKPWYFMLTSNMSTAGFSYDPILRKWHSIDFLSLDKCKWIISSSCGLVCFMDYDNQNRIFLCNPITRDWKRLPAPPTEKSCDYNALALSVDRFSHEYVVTNVKSEQLPGDFLQWDFTIQIYESKSCVWEVLIDEVFVGWRGGDESVICNGILYCLVYSFSGNNERRHGLIMYNIGSKSLCTSLMQTMIMVPCPLTCGRLMNVRGKLVLVGGIGRLNKPDIIRGVGIWELHGQEWQEIARIPHKFFQVGEFDDVFVSSGAEDVIFIHSYGSPNLLMFDMTKKQWEWTMRCPITKRSDLQQFDGFCFEPRLEIKF